jgi:tol-pal system protein YbgF
MSAMRDDNRRLNETVTELRSDRRAQDRKVRDLERKLDDLRAKQATDTAASVPVLPVEVVAPPSAPAAAPDGPRVVGVADDGTEIVYEGDAASLRSVQPTALGESDASARSAGGRPARTAAPLSDVPAVADRLEVTGRIPKIDGSREAPGRSAAGATTVASHASEAAAPEPHGGKGSARDRAAPSARAPARVKTRDHDAAGERSGDAPAEYRAAVELVKSAKYDDAVAALRAFIAHYPRHDYADNAQYWLGEAFYAQKDYPRALSEFRRVVEVYPRGNKVPDALLKVGFCHQAMGQAEKARAVLEQVVNTYPKSEPAMLAAKRLEAP